MTRRIYPKPPIVEAVIDLRFNGIIEGEELLEALRRRLADRYNGVPKRQDLLEVDSTFSPDSVSTTARRSPHLTFLRSEDGLRLVGCGTQRMSVHVLAPYPGWESFIEQVEEAIEALPSEVRAGALSSLAVRYIDRITLPKTLSSFSDYVTIMPPRPEPMPSTLSAFHVVTQTKDNADDTTAVLTLASGPPTADGEPVLIYDLVLQREGEPLCGLDRWRPIVEALHERQRDIFEKSITQKMRGLFQ